MFLYFQSCNYEECVSDPNHLGPRKLYMHFPIVMIITLDENHVCIGKVDQRNIWVMFVDCVLTMDIYKSLIPQRN